MKKERKKNVRILKEKKGSMGTGMVNGDRYINGNELVVVISPVC